MKRRVPSEDAGFTLLELLIVIAILGLLGVVGTIQLTGYLSNAKADTAKLQLDQLITALDLYRVDVGRLPTTDEGLGALLAQPQGTTRWRGPYLRKSQALDDPWGNRFLYKRPGEHREYDLFSYGADGKAGGDGADTDITNWDEHS